MKKSIAFISYFYPPTKAVGTLRNYHLSRQFLNNDYQVTVYTGRKPGYVGRDELVIDPEIKVRNTLAIDYHLIDRWRPKKEKVSISSRVPTSRSFAGRIIDSLPVRLLIGEGGIYYIIVTLFKLLFSRRPDIIWSSFSPISDHVIASMYKTFHPKTVWIADFRDTLREPGGERTWFQKFEDGIYKRMIGKANLVPVVSQNYREHMRPYCDETLLLRNGIGKLEFSTNGQQGKSQKFRIAHLGALYGGRRDPSKLFESLRELIEEGQIERDKIELVYAGKEGKIWQEFAARSNIQDLVVDLKLLPLSESLQLQQSAQINLLLAFEVNGLSQFPAKFYEYLAASKPIILILSGPRDVEFDEIINNTRAGILICDNDSNDSLKSFVVEKYRQWLADGDTSQDLNMDRVKEFYWDNLFQQFHANHLPNASSVETPVNS